MVLIWVVAESINLEGSSEAVGKLFHLKKPIVMFFQLCFGWVVQVSSSLSPRNKRVLHLSLLL